MLLDIQFVVGGMNTIPGDVAGQVDRQDIDVCARCILRQHDNDPTSATCWSWSCRSRKRRVRNSVSLFLRLPPVTTADRRAANTAGSKTSWTKCPAISMPSGEWLRPISYRETRRLCQLQADALSKSTILSFNFNRNVSPVYSDKCYVLLSSF